MSEAGAHPYFDLALLATDFVPDDGAEQGLRTIIGQQDNDLERLDEELSHLEARIRELRARRTRLVGCRDANKAFLAPLRRMPPEILGEIFVRVPHVMPEGYRSIVASASPLILMRVCRRWRRIAAGTPQLWTALKFMFDARSVRDDIRTSLVDMWLYNSGALPIDLQLHRHEMAVPAVTQIVMQNFHRFHSLGARFGQTFLDQLSSRTLPISAPSLRRLEILDSSQRLGLDDGAGRQLNQVFKGCVRAPNLTDLALRSPEWLELFELCPHTLRHLTIVAWNEQSPLDFLRDFQNLSFLEIGSIGRTRPPVIDFQSPLTFPSLHTLKISGCNNDGDSSIFTFLGAIRAPALRALSIKVPNHGHDEQVLDSLVTFLGENPPLQQLSLGFARNMDASSLISFICRLSCLRSLYLGLCVLGDAVLQVLTPKPSSLPTSWICPRLSALLLYKCRVPGDLLVDLVHNRTPVVGWTGLSRVDLLECFNEFGGELDVQGQLPNGEHVKVDVRQRVCHQVLDEFLEFYEGGKVEVR